ncbi:MAG TPA: ribosome recycling factor [Vitreimonas sp.]|nr:ribosome recycling factor [Vitreimonas sp.]
MAFDFTQFQTQAQKALDHFKQELATLRTGRAHSQLLDSVRVDAYGTKMMINEVANVSVPDSNLLTVTPWDKSLLSAIEKAIASAGINLNPVVDGDMIRIVVPALTEERRKEMVKVLHQKAESVRVMLRSVRTDTKKDIEKQKGTSGVSEDDIKKEVETLEKKTKEFLDQVDQLVTVKEKDLLTV